jgi:hypothetical protein
MKSHNFSAKSKTNSLTGVLITSDDVNKIYFDTDVSGFENIEIKEKKIKDIGNFVGSLIRRFDVNEVFDSVIFNKNEYEIIREGIKPSDEKMNVYVKGDIKDQDHLVFPEQNITLFATNNHSYKFLLEDLGLKLVTVPVDFKYNRDPILNAILEYNVMPFDYDRSINEKILKIIKKARSELIGKNKDSYKNVIYVYINNHFSYSLSGNIDTKRILFVIPVGLIPVGKIKNK